MKGQVSALIHALGGENRADPSAYFSEKKVALLQRVLWVEEHIAHEGGSLLGLFTLLLIHASEHALRMLKRIQNLLEFKKNVFQSQNNSPSQDKF